MRKLLIGAAMLLLAPVAYGQAVNESAIIPVSVTLNAVSRLNIESGGNIKFVFTSINDYNTGFSGATEPLYRTTVSVASSREFDVNMYSEAANFLPTDNAANVLAIGQLEYQLDWTGTAAAPTIVSTFTQMLATPTAIVTNAPGGDGSANRFEIWWRIGTPANTLGTFLSQGNIPADHYTANIFIELSN